VDRLVLPSIVEENSKGIEELEAMACEVSEASSRDDSASLACKNRIIREY